MKELKPFIISLIIIAGLFWASIALAAPTVQYFRTILPVDSTENVGSSSARWDEGWFNSLDVSSLTAGTLTISSLVSGDMDVLGCGLFGTTSTSTICGNNALSTIDGDLIIQGNSTTTNATTTNFFSTTASSTNLFASFFTLGGKTLTLTSNATLGGTNTGDVSMAGTPDYLTILGQTITRGLIDLTTDVTGDLPLASLNQVSANSVLGNITGSTADATSVATSSLFTWTGTGDVVRATSPTLVTPTLGVASATSLANPTFTTASGAMGFTPSAGSNLNISLSTTGDFVVNTNQLYVDTSAGNVGIGTTTPASKLAVSGGVSVGANYNIAAPTNGMIVEGNVGIGNTSPATALDVSGDIRANRASGYPGLILGNHTSPTSSNAGQYGLQIYYDITNLETVFRSALFGSSYHDMTFRGRDMVFETGTGSLTDRMIIDRNGLFGFGTSTAWTEFHFVKNQNAETAQYIQNTTSGTTAYSALYLTEDTSPSTKWGALFHINSGYTTNGVLQASGTYLDSGDTGGLWLGARNSTSGAIHFYTDGVAASKERMTITNGGNVGIGTTSPLRLMTVYAASSATIQVADATSGSAAADGSYFQQSGTSGYLVNQETGNFGFGTDNSIDMTILSGGNVGIGTTTPSTNLHVTASASNATSTLTVGKTGQNKGTCLELFDSAGTAVYAYVKTGETTFTLSSTSCK